MTGSALIIILGLALFVPWHPLIATFYYEYCVHWAIDQGLQFGADLISTYGPLGFVGLPFYHPGTFTAMVFANIVLYGIMVLFLWRFARQTLRDNLLTALWVVCILLLPGIPITKEWSSVLFAPYIMLNLFVLQNLLSEEKKPRISDYLMVSLLGMFALVKVSFIVMLSFGIAIVSTDQIVRLRQWPSLGIVFVGSIVFFWIAAGQSLLNVGAYLLGSIDLIAGYKDGMASIEGTVLSESQVVFAVASLAFTTTTFVILRCRIGWRALLVAVALGATLFILFQNAFVRQDPQHFVPSCLTFCSLVLLFLPFLWRISSSNTKLKLALLANCLLAVVLLRLALPTDKWAAALAIFFAKAKDLPSLVVQGVGPLQNARETHLKELKQQFPMEKEIGIVETSTVDIGIAEAHGFATALRPSITLYGAMTPKISRRNQEYLKNIGGPKTILLPVNNSIDGRFPAGTDALGLLAQKTFFRASGIVGDNIVLTRRSQESARHLKIMETLEVEFGEKVSLPDVGNNSILLQVEVEPTLLGKVFSILYKPAPVFITIEIGGNERSFRLIKSMAKEGILISPLLHDADSFKSFYADVDVQTRPSSFRIDCERNRAWHYYPNVKVVLSELEVN